MITIRTHDLQHKRYFTGKSVIQSQKLKSKNENFALWSIFLFLPVCPYGDYHLNCFNMKSQGYVVALTAVGFFCWLFKRLWGFMFLNHETNFSSARREFASSPKETDSAWYILWHTPFDHHDWPNLT